MNGKEWDSKLDIFSFGAMLYYLLFKKERMFFIEVMKSQESLHQSFEIELNSSEFENKSFFVHILKNCLTNDSKERPSATELLKYFDS